MNNLVRVGPVCLLRRIGYEGTAARAIRSENENSTVSFESIVAPHPRPSI